MKKMKVEVEVGPLGLLFNCPYCEQRIYIPTEEILNNGDIKKEMDFTCEGCGKSFIISVYNREKEE